LGKSRHWQSRQLSTVQSAFVDRPTSGLTSAWRPGNFIPARQTGVYGVNLGARGSITRQRTMLSNAIRGHLAELGIVSAKGRKGTGALLEIIADAEDSRVPPVARGILDVLARRYSALGAEIGSIASER
jgi:hypothetical protein